MFFGYIVVKIIELLYICVEKDSPDSPQAISGNRVASLQSQQGNDNGG